MSLSRFIHDTTPCSLPARVLQQARQCLIDITATAVAARRTDLSRIVHDFAATTFAGRGALLWQDGREVSAPGAALANGASVDALDIHDGHSLTKGHAGAAVVPAALATLSAGDAAVTGAELLTSIAVGYEVALRAGRTLHATAADYHSSGSWNALGCAAVVARRLRLNDEQTRHALGIAEYHGPRSPMMRCINHPTMLKDGSGWGAMTGVSAGLLASAGFTGAPAETVEPTAASTETVGAYWSDLGERWELLDLYFKPYAVCRWAHPAVEGALRLKRTRGFDADDVVKVAVETFHEACRLAIRHPRTTEQAQYSLPFPVAAALCFGRLAPPMLMGSALDDERVLRLATTIELRESPEMNRDFPSRRRARVVIELASGETFAVEAEPSWEGTASVGEDELLAKFHQLTSALPSEEQQRLLRLLESIAELSDAAILETTLSGLAH